MFSQSRGKELKVLVESSDYAGNASWNGDGSCFASAVGNTVVIWNALSDSVEKIYSNLSNGDDTSNIISVEYSKNGQYLLSIQQNKNIVLYSTDLGVPVTMISGEQNSSTVAALSSGGYSIVLPFDNKNLYEYLRLIETKKYILSQKLQLDSEICFLSINNAGNRILASSPNGKSFFIFVEKDSWQIIQTYDWFANDFCFPKISSDGKKFLIPKNQNEIVIASLNEENEEPTLKSINLSQKFISDACFSDDGKFIVVGTNDGKINIFDCENSEIKYATLLDESEIPTKVSFSPDGNSVLITTKNGRLYRWNLVSVKYQKKSDTKLQDSIFGKGKSGEDSEQKSQSENANSENQNASSFSNESANENSTKNASFGSGEFSTRHGTYADVFVGVGNSPSPFMLSAQASFDVLFYDILKPFYIGGQISPFIAFPNSDFPYTYMLEDEKLNSPVMIGGNLCAVIGLFVMPFTNKDFGFSAELLLGGGISAVWNGKLGTEGISSKIFPSVNVGTKLGFSWKFINVYVGAYYDSVQKVLINGGLGANFKLKFGGKKNETE